jgi:hypothetical protein
MADFNFQPVASQVKPVPQMSLGDMMNVARGAQQYQQAEQINPLLLQQSQQAVEQAKQINPLLLQQAQQQVEQSKEMNPLLLKSQQQSTLTGQIALSLEEQRYKERMGAQQFFSNPQNFQDETGMIDLKKINESSHLFPLTFPDISQKFSTLAKSQTESKNADRGLDTGGRELIASTIAPLGYAGVQDPKEYIKKLIDLKDQYPNDLKLKNAVNAKIALLAQVSGPSPDVAKGAIISSEQLLSATQGREQFTPKPGTLSTGSKILPTVTTPPIGGGQPKIEVGNTPLANVGLPPGSRMIATGRNDINNNPTAYVYDEPGRLLGEITIPIGVSESQMPGAPQAAPQAMPQGAPVIPQQRAAPASNPPVTNAPVRMRAGETQDTYAAAQKIRMDASDVAAQVPDQIFNANKIIELAGEADLGKGSQLLSDIKGGYAFVPWTSDKVTKFNDLGHFLQLQTASLSKGIGTDAGRDMFAGIAGKREWDEQSLKNTARINRALATGGELFNRGVQNSFNKNNDPFSARDFKNKWSTTLGVNGIDAIRLHDLTKNNDRIGLKEFVDYLGGPDSKRFKDATQKIGQMSLLLKGQ